MVKPCDSCKRYKSPYMSVDAVLHDQGKILLIKRGNPDEPYYGNYALPGGFVDYNEETSAAVVREVWEETGLKASVHDLIGVFSKKDRDPLGHVISTAYALKVESGTLKPNSDAKAAAWFPIDALPPLAFDHEEIIATFRQRNRILSQYNGWDLQKPLVFCSHSRSLMHASLLICKYVIDHGGVPINSFTNFGYFLYELVPRHDIAESINNIINRCDEQWVFGPFSEGVQMEVDMCKEIGKKIRFFSITDDEVPCLIREVSEDELRKITS